MITHTIITMATSIAIAIPTVAPITALVVLVSLVTVDMLDVVDVTNAVVVVDGTADVKVCCTGVKDIRLVGNHETDWDILMLLKDVTPVLPRVLLLLIEDGLFATEI